MLEVFMQCIIMQTALIYFSIWNSPILMKLLRRNFSLISKFNVIGSHPLELRVLLNSGGFKTRSGVAYDRPIAIINQIIYHWNISDNGISKFSLLGALAADPAPTVVAIGTGKEALSLPAWLEREFSDLSIQPNLLSTRNAVSLINIMLQEKRNFIAFLGLADAQCHFLNDVPPSNRCS